MKGREEDVNGAYSHAMKHFLPLVYGTTRMKLKMSQKGNLLCKAVPVAMEATTIHFIKNVWKQLWMRVVVEPC